jgi:hypothetical protein
MGEAMPDGLAEVLREALDDEYRARATYRAVLDAHGEVLPFARIVESEERHIRALQRLCEHHGLEVPADRWASRVAAPGSLEAACEAAVDAERDNRTLYERLLQADAVRGHPDVQETFKRLLGASRENHLPAFERALARERVGAGGQSRRRRHRGGRRPDDGA